MSMTELEHHLLNCLEKLQQEFASSQKTQSKRLAKLEERQEEHAQNLHHLTGLLNVLESLLQHLNNACRRI